MVFTAMMSDGSALPSYITFDGVNTFTILTTNTAHVGTYSIKISGSLTHDGGVLTITDIIWKVTIVKLCSAMAITTSSVGD